MLIYKYCESEHRKRKEYVNRCIKDIGKDINFW